MPDSMNEATRSQCPSVVSPCVLRVHVLLPESAKDTSPDFKPINLLQLRR